MKSLTLPIVLGLLAIMCHAAPSSVQPKPRQVTTLVLTFYGAGENPPSYEVDVPLESEENFQSFNISESLSSITHAAGCYLSSSKFSIHAYHVSLGIIILTSVAANPLSVSSISLGGPGFCVITGVDGSETTVQGGDEVDVGPPQVQVSGVCSTF